VTTSGVIIDGLTRTFRQGKGWRPRGKDVTALDHLSLEIRRQEVHGLLGPNGAGKTTLCKILSTILLPTSGTATVLGHDVVRDAAKLRPLLGIVFGGERGLYARLTARQNLQYWAALYKIPGRESATRTDRLLARLGLAGRADEQVETFSRGMKQRLHLARGLIGNPEIVLFDEPTIGMDPVAAHDFRKLIGELREDGLTILITTHDMAEAEEICDRVTLIDHGRVIASETPRSLAAMSARYRWVEAEDVDPILAERLLDVEGVLEVFDKNGLLRVRTEGESPVQAVVGHLLGNGVRSVRAMPPTLEEVYIELIGSRGMGV
jgi:ABC-2 type transport system ATP-binding protein